MLKFEDILAAREKLKSSSAELYMESPVLYSSGISGQLSEQLGRAIRVYFKCEHLQPVGSFKVRGAMNFVNNMDKTALEKGIVTHSSGNHGIAVAAVGHELGVPVVVVAPHNAPLTKINRMLKYKAEVVFCEPTFESRSTTCNQIVAERGMTEIPPFDHEWTMTGQGTLGIEIMEQVPNVDAVVAAVGGCGMISGVTRAVKTINPLVKIFGAEPLHANDTKTSLDLGFRTGPSDPTKSTICDALRVSPPGKLCWEVVSKEVDGVYLVPDEKTVEAMRLLAEELKQVTEPSGACATGLLLTSEFLEALREDPTLNNVVVLICGGNIELSDFKTYL